MIGRGDRWFSLRFWFIIDSHMTYIYSIKKPFFIYFSKALFDTKNRYGEANHTKQYLLIFGFVFT
jgi:hypothetical protein